MLARLCTLPATQRVTTRFVQNEFGLEERHAKRVFERFQRNAADARAGEAAAAECGVTTASATEEGSETETPHGGGGREGVVALARQPRGAD